MCCWIWRLPKCRLASWGFYQWPLLDQRAAPTHNTINNICWGFLHYLLWWIIGFPGMLWCSKPYSCVHLLCHNVAPETQHSVACVLWEGPGRKSKHPFPLCVFCTGLEYLPVCCAAVKRQCCGVELHALGHSVWGCFPLHQYLHRKCDKHMSLFCFQSIISIISVTLWKYRRLKSEPCQEDSCGIMTSLRGGNGPLTLKVAKASEAMSNVDISTYLKKS